jgi:hypothetical protein
MALASPQITTPLPRMFQGVSCEICGNYPHVVGKASQNNKYNENKYV